MPGAEVQGPREGAWLCPDLGAHPRQTTTLVEASISSYVEEAALGKLQGPSNLTVFCPNSEGIPERSKASEKWGSGGRRSGSGGRRWGQKEWVSPVGCQSLSLGW